MENRICNYCKQKGHIKRDCKNKNTRLIKPRYTPPTVKSQVAPVEKLPKEDVYKTDFPSLGNVDNKNVKNTWGKESFKDVLNKVPIIKEEVSKEDTDGMVLLN